MAVLLLAIFAATGALLRVQLASKVRSAATLDITLAAGFLVSVALVIPLARRTGRLLEAQGSRLEMHSAALRASEARFRTLVQNSSDVVTIVGADSAIHYHSPSVEHVFGFAPSELVGMRFKDWLHPDDFPWAFAVLAEALEEPGPTRFIEGRLRDSSGRWRACEAAVSNLLDDPNVCGFVLNIRDMSERKRLEEELTHQAFHDPLTDLANRALFRDRVEHALARTARQTTGCVGVIFIDLDGFKLVNDALGHQVGDQLLVAVAERLRRCVRPGDTIGRLGGDEFAILLEDAATKEEATAVAGRITDALREPFALPGGSVDVRASIGIAGCLSGTENADELLRNADLAMYRAKASGRARVEFFDPSMRGAASERLEMESSLRRAIEHEDLIVVYQPVVDLHTGRMRAAEALVRWEHPVKGLLDPAEFISLAEETGLIVPLGALVLRQACRQAKRWHDAVPRTEDLAVSVNLSPRQIQEPTIVADIAGALEESGLDPRHLILEITEGSMAGDLETTCALLTNLKDLGVRIAIDDFGTGYSSLAYLQRLPLDIIKIDKLFIDGIAKGPEESALARAIIKLAGTLKLRTVAEGIESQEQANLLQTLACDWGQGFHLGAPMATPAFGRALTTNLSGASISA